MASQSICRVQIYEAVLRKGVSCISLGIPAPASKYCIVLEFDFAEAQGV